MASVYNGDAGGVVASILKTSQPVEQNGRCFRTTNVANDSAHGWSVVAAVLSRKIRAAEHRLPICAVSRAGSADSRTAPIAFGVGRSGNMPRFRRAKHLPLAAALARSSTPLRLDYI